MTDRPRPEDADPLTPPDYAARLDILERRFSQTYGGPLVAEPSHRVRRLLLYAAAAALFLAVGFGWGRASALTAPAPSGTMLVEPRGIPVTGVTTLDAPRGGSPTPTGLEPPAVIGGSATFVDPSYGPLYLALPEGPGIRVTIHGPKGSVTRTSTDAGPALGRQRAGIIADVSFDDFHRLCGCDPWLVGKIPVAVEYGPTVTPPATDR